MVFEKKKNNKWNQQATCLWKNVTIKINPLFIEPWQRRKISSMISAYKSTITFNFHENKQRIIWKYVENMNAILMTVLSHVMLHTWSNCVDNDFFLSANEYTCVSTCSIENITQSKSKRIQRTYQWIDWLPTNIYFVFCRCIHKMQHGIIIIRTYNVTHIFQMLFVTNRLQLNCQQKHRIMRVVHDMLIIKSSCHRRIYHTNRTHLLVVHRM
jgi:hypothetical protein